MPRLASTVLGSLRFGLLNGVVSGQRIGTSALPSWLAGEVSRILGLRIFREFIAYHFDNYVWRFCPHHFSVCVLSSNYRSKDFGRRHNVLIFLWIVFRFAAGYMSVESEWMSFPQPGCFCGDRSDILVADQGGIAQTARHRGSRIFV